MRPIEPSTQAVGGGAPPTAPETSPKEPAPPTSPGQGGGEASEAGSTSFLASPRECLKVLWERGKAAFRWDVVSENAGVDSTRSAHSPENGTASPANEPLSAAPAAPVERGGVEAGEGENRRKTYAWAEPFFWTVPKIGNEEKDNEDFGSSGPSAKETIFRAVIADGASSTWSPGSWARLLVTRFLPSWDGSPFSWLDDEAWEEGLRDSRTLWEATLPKIRHALNYLNEIDDKKRKVGAGSCLLVLECDLAAKTWRAIAYGNCLLVHARSDEILFCGPYDSPEQFDAYTPLISSVATVPFDIKRLQIWDGEFESGDDFFLMTDELAKWLVRDKETHLRTLRGVRDQRQFSGLVRRLRDERKGSIIRVKIRSSLLSI